MQVFWRDVGVIDEGVVWIVGFDVVDCGVVEVVVCRCIGDWGGVVCVFYVIMLYMNSFMLS